MTNMTSQGKLDLEKSPNIAKIKLYLAINMKRSKKMCELLCCEDNNKIKTMRLCSVTKKSKIILFFISH